MDVDLNARIDNSFDSDKVDEESIGSSDSEDRDFKLSKFAQILYRHRDIHNKFENPLVWFKSISIAHKGILQKNMKSLKVLRPKAEIQGEKPSHKL